MPTPLRVLIVEDSEDDAELLIWQLRQGGYAPVWERADALQTMDGALGRGPWDIVISDHSMPHFSAIKALELLKEKSLDIPVIILSGAIDEESAIAAMRAGASDYIMKGNSARLLPAIERELREAARRRKARQLEKQYYQSQKMEAVGRLAGGVAHDFNNLLTVILGYCTLALNDIDEKKTPARSTVEEIKSSAERAATLTRQLLAFSKRQVFESKVLDLNAVLANVERLLRRLIGEDIELVTIPGHDLGRIKADPSQIEQVIMNLAVNARDAMPQGGRLTIETANGSLTGQSLGGGFEVKPGAYVRLSVRDTGSGMDGNILAHLFEPFFTTKEPGKGTGLGLATVYGIVKQSSGYISVDSSPGGGTEFRIHFPQVKEKAAPLVGSGLPSRSLHGSEVVLVVEDEKTVGDLLRRILVKYGYTVLAASSAAEALRLFGGRQGAIRLVITDVILPQMSGGELAKEILKLRADMPVLYISGYTDNVIAQQGLLEPGIHFLQKPFMPEALAGKVREVLEKHSEGGNACSIKEQPAS